MPPQFIFSKDVTDAVELKDAIRTQDADANVRFRNQIISHLCSLTIYRGENEQGQWLARRRQSILSSDGSTKDAKKIMK